MPAITVILPVYNGANYLRESIDSVLAQTFADFELHVLDDGSTDDGPAIVLSYADSRVRYSKNDGRFGLFKTLNRGCREATAPWVRLWAHDDRMVPTCLEKFVAFAASHPDVGMVYSDFLDMDPDGNLTGREDEHKPQRDRTPDVAGADASALLFLCFGCLPGNISTVMIRKDAWAELGGFIEGIQQAPDYEMWVRLSEKYPVGFVREKLVELRNHPLQLGRLGQKQMNLIEEEKMVFDALRRRLAGVVSETDFLRCWQEFKGRGHVHAIARAVARGDITTARRGVRALAGYGRVGRQVFRWLWTVNGHVFTPSRAEFFDRITPRLNANVVSAGEMS